MNPIPVEDDSYNDKLSISAEASSNNIASVIVVSYNGADVIEACLCSLMAQTFSRVEIIIVDNASQDNTVALVRKRFPRVTLIENESNLGFASANNIGIAHAHGHFIALLNQDAWADPRWLEEIGNTFAQNPAVGMCASKVLYSDEPDRINSTGVLLYQDLATVNRGLDEKDRGQYDEPQEVFGPYGAAAGFRRKVLKKVGGLPDRYYLMHEEDDLAWRVRFAGWRCTYIPSAVVFHRRSTSLGIHSPIKLYYGERNRIWNVIKYLPWQRLLLVTFFTVLRYLKLARLQITGGRRSETERDKNDTFSVVRVLMRAWIDGIAGIPQALRQRRIIWQTRKVSTSEINRWMKTFGASLNEITEK